MQNSTCVLSMRSIRCAIASKMDKSQLLTDAIPHIVLQEAEKRNTCYNCCLIIWEPLLVGKTHYTENAYSQLNLLKQFAWAHEVHQTQESSLLAFLTYSL